MVDDDKPIPYELALPEWRGRADSDEKKLDASHRLLMCWEQMPEQRLGQLIENARTVGLNSGDGAVDLFYIEDGELVAAVERYVAARGGAGVKS